MWKFIKLACSSNPPQEHKRKRKGRERIEVERRSKVIGTEVKKKNNSQWYVLKLMNFIRYDIER